MRAMTAEPALAFERHSRGARRVSTPHAVPSRLARLQVMAVNCETLSEIQPQQLALTYWLDTSSMNRAGTIAVRFTGQHATATRPVCPSDAFSVVETAHVHPGTGPVAVTTRVDGVRAGEWRVTARPIDPPARPTPRGNP